MVADVRLSSKNCTLGVSCGHLGCPKAPKWSPWGGLGGTFGAQDLQNGALGEVLGALLEPMTSKMEALRDSGGTVGDQGGPGEAQGTKKYQFWTSFWYPFDDKNVIKNRCEKQH